MPGYLDARGIYHYEEDDPAAPFSDTLNLLASSTSDRVFELREGLASVGSAGSGFGIYNLTGVTLGTGGTTWGRGIVLQDAVLFWGAITLGTGGALTGAVTFAPWAPPSSGPARTLFPGMGPRAVLGSAGSWDVSHSRYRPLSLVRHSDTQLRVLDENGLDLSPTYPFLWAAGDSLTVQAVIPVALA